MRILSASTVREELDFMEKAAANFASNPAVWSFSAGEITPGCLLALRWGLGDDCVLVMRLDEFHTPTVYSQAVKHAAEEAM